MYPRAGDVSEAAAAAVGAPPPKLEALPPEALPPPESARLSALLPLYRKQFVAARFTEHTRADRASCSRVLQRIPQYPRLHEARRPLA
jgi:hypothetical protein